MLNQEMHKNLRQNKAGVLLKNVERLPNNYKRPPGFLLIPGDDLKSVKLKRFFNFNFFIGLLGTIPGGDHHILNLMQTNGKTKAVEKVDDPKR